MAKNKSTTKQSLVKLTQKQIDGFLRKMHSCKTCAETSAFIDTNHQKRAELILPLGELTNPEISGFVYAWKLQGRIEILKSTECDKHNAGIAAQGLEGFCRVRMTLSSALLVAQELPRGRYGMAVSQ